MNSSIIPYSDKFSSLIPCDGERSVDHFFLLCLVALGLWWKLFQLEEVYFAIPFFMDELFTIDCSGFSSNRKLWALWSCAICAVLWLERNARMVEDRPVEVGSL